MKLEKIDNPKRDLNGFYSHPQLPVWDESTTKEQINLWLKSHSVKLNVVTLENDADEDVCKKYFDIGIGGCSDWNPTVPHDDAILLSIHDTDDGPMAAYAVPDNEELEQDKLERLKNEAFNAHDEATQKMHAYACALPLGQLRTDAFEIYQNIRLATRA